MGLTMNERKAVTAVMVARYCRASKKQKGRLLDELPTPQFDSGF